MVTLVALKVLEALGYDGLRPVVERARGLVEEQHARPGDDRPGDHQPLSLPAGERQPTLLQDRVHPHRHLADVLVDTGKPGRFPRVVNREGHGTNDVLED